ncbi:hypothetical protein FRZ44_42310 [Hypericibacter terrae]|uniref:Uncharacterized protein n=1 Tax=Hypericibacter terrae TaxID=2602015 RepID=A0A5J6MS91_9PROT|nr:hypothetical protein [Hypericibacter terrae]QEX18920.1 hypothetical protein FRZ44_42310 [Hypericibacter terrae]
MSEWSTEPSLDELLEDPATKLVMSGDHVKESALRCLLARMSWVVGQRRHGATAGPAPAPCSEW